MLGSDEDEDIVAIANFDGDANGGGSDVTEVIKEEDAANSERGALADHPPPPTTAATATVAPFHDEDDHYDNIQVRPRPSAEKP